MYFRNVFNFKHLLVSLTLKLNVCLSTLLNQGLVSTKYQKVVINQNLFRQVVFTRLENSCYYLTFASSLRGMLAGLTDHTGELCKATTELSCKISKWGR